MKKRSLTIAGHRTSITLEEDFWVELKRLAEMQGLTVAQLVTQIDQTRDLQINLCSALRLHVLRALKGKSD